MKETNMVPSMRERNDPNVRYEEAFALAVSLRDRLEANCEESLDATAVVLANILIEKLELLPLPRT